MNGDLPDHRVAALNVHRILNRAAGRNGAAGTERKSAGSAPERTAMAGAGRPPTAE